MSFFQVRDKHDHENVLASELALLTKPKAASSEGGEAAGAFFGGDLESAVTVMRTIADRLQYLLQTKAMFNSESFVQEIFQNVFRSASNLMSVDLRPAWMDLPNPSRIKLVSELMETLEDHAFLLADVTLEPKVFTESTKYAGKTGFIFVHANFKVLTFS